MRKIKLFLLLLAFSLTAPGVCFSGEPGPAGLRVGVILPFSGDAASVGTAIKNGLVMALEGLPENSRARLEWLYEDDQMSARHAVAAFNKLLSTGGLDALINASSGTGKALAPIAEQHKVPFLSISSDPSISAGRQYVFSLWVTPAEEAKAMLPYALSRGYKKVARISSIQDGVFACNRAFDKVNQGRIKVVLDEEYPVDVKDFRSYLTKLRALPDIDAIMVVLLPGQCAAFTKQARQMGLKQPFLGYEMFEDSAEVKASEGALTGQVYVNADDPAGDFLERYQKRFPGASSWMSANGYDAAALIAAAAQQGLRGQALADFLNNLKNFKGALGRYSAAGDHTFTLPAAVKVVTANGFERLNYPLPAAPRSGER